MIRRLSVAAALGAATLLASPAQALNARTWISGTGSDDANCGPIATPCRTLQFAHDQTSIGGQINVKDSAGYGSVTITKALTIVGDGSLSGVLAPSGDAAITINAGSNDKVVLRGLTVDGSGVGLNGIVFNSGGALDITNCVVQNTVASGVNTGNGILLRASSDNNSTLINISGTIVSNHANHGIAYAPANSSGTATIAIDRTTAVGNLNGIYINMRNTSVVARTVVANTKLSNNGQVGLYVSGSLSQVWCDLCDIANNVSVGVGIYNGSYGAIGRSSIINNGVGLRNIAARISSYKDNRIEGNTIDFHGVIDTATLK